ncbi:MAG: aminopeptidase P family protein [Firmicutes bacterium]|nr:aminopeptidase P family protein [Bacillota bacterium]
MNKRLQRLQEKLAEHSLEAILISQPANRRYISGFSGSSGYLLVGREQAFLITDFRYLEQASQQAPDFEIRKAKENLAQSLAPLLDETGWRQVAFEKNDLTYALYSELTQGTSVAWKPLAGLVEELRMIKDEQELAILRRGAAVTDAAFAHILTMIKPGVTEQELSLELEYFMRRRGASRASFRYIVASGPRGAMPHGTASSKQLAAGELLTMDFGAVFDAYCTDITRTVCLGEPDEQQRRVYEVVLQAQQEARARIRPGMTGREIDALARNLIKEAGFDEQFGHGLGHGLGLEVHEEPRLAPLSKTVLQPGMVITVEPGIYIPGWGGVRIEDMVLLTAEGAELLTHSPRELIIV